MLRVPHGDLWHFFKGDTLALGWKLFYREASSNKLSSHHLGENVGRLANDLYEFL